jgi:hypothetical protein
MSEWSNFIKEVGFPAAVTFILVWQMRHYGDRILNDVYHELREIKEAMVALLEYVRKNGLPRS